MKKLLIVLGVISGLWGQPITAPAVTYTAPPPPMVSNISASRVGNAGNSTFYYWVVAIYVGGKSFPSGPALIANAPNSLSVSNYVQVNWTPISGATGYDVLRTTTPQPPSGSCANCAVVTNTPNANVNDQGGALGAYTVTSMPQVATTCRLDNLTSATPTLVCSPYANSGGSPAGAAGGCLSGTYPNPDLAGITNPSSVPYVDSGNCLTEDQYFTYVPIPGAPVAGTKFSRLNLLDSTTPSSTYYDTDYTFDQLIRRTVTAPSHTQTNPGASTIMGQMVRMTYNPSASWDNYPSLQVTAGGTTSVVEYPAGATQAINGLYGGGYEVFNSGSGAINTQRGNYIGAQVTGASNVFLNEGLYVQVVHDGTGTVQNVRGIVSIAGPTGTNPGATSSLTVYRGIAYTYDDISTVYGYRMTRSGAVNPTTAWGISEETSWPSRLYGRLSVNQSTDDGATALQVTGDATYRHWIANGTSPTITSGFGTTPAIAGKDSAGRITVGTGGAASSGVITFGTAWTIAPSCVANNETTQLAIFATATTTTLTLSSSIPFTAADKLTWVCVGY